VFQECTHLALTTWPHLHRTQGHPKIGLHPPRTGRRRQHHQQHLQVYFPLFSLFFSSVSPHPSDLIRLPQSESLPPKIKVSLCLIRYTSKPQRINISPLPPCAMSITPRGLQWKRSHPVLVVHLVCCYFTKRLRRTMASAAGAQLDVWMMSRWFPEPSVVVPHMTNAVLLASCPLAVFGASASVPKYGRRSSPSCLFVTSHLHAQVTPRWRKRLAMRITIPATHTMSTCPWWGPYHTHTHTHTLI